MDFNIENGNGCKRFECVADFFLKWLNVSKRNAEKGEGRGVAMRMGRLNRMELCFRKELFLTEDRRQPRCLQRGRQKWKWRLRKGNSKSNSLLEWCSVDSSEIWSKQTFYLNGSSSLFKIMKNKYYSVLDCMATEENDIDYCGTYFSCKWTCNCQCGGMSHELCRLNNRNLWYSCVGVLRLVTL